MSCEKHKKLIEKYNGSLSELANDIGELHYEALSQFLGHLSKKIKVDGTKDFEGGRKKLASQLFDSSNSISNSSESIWKAWLISKPFMK